MSIATIAAEQHCPVVARENPLRRVAEQGILVLEHFKRREVGRVLKERYRVLKPGGTLRLAVPDFSKLFEVFQRENRIDLVIGALFGRQDYLYNTQYNMFDFASLAQALEQTRLVNVRRYDWRANEHADIDDFSQAYIPHIDKEHGTLISLNVECKKPL